MKLSRNPFIYANVRLITAVALASILIIVPGVSLAIDKDAHEDRTELRIKDLHAKLKITQAQEGQWGKVAQAMLDDAKTMDALTQTRIDHAKAMTAVDDLKSYGEIADAHANGIKTLIPVFADLYASMSDIQKKEADQLFQQREHKPNPKKHGHKKSAGK